MLGHSSAYTHFILAKENILTIIPIATFEFDARWFLLTIILNLLKIKFLLTALQNNIKCVI